MRRHEVCRDCACDLDDERFCGDTGTHPGECCDCFEESWWGDMPGFKCKFPREDNGVASFPDAVVDFDKVKLF